VREGIKKIIRPLRDIRVVGETDTIAGVLRLVEHLQPHAVILDLSLDGCTELDGLLHLRRSFPHTPVLVLSMHSEERFAVKALTAGAAGYVTKAMAAEEVIHGIRKVASGGQYISPRLAEILAKNLSSPIDRLPHQTLTQRELQVLCLLGAGMQTKQVASKLMISVSSVNTYRARIFRKMNMSSNSSLVRYVVEYGLGSV
jgi:DNA-binding NarL/FixJ family response regulator